MDEKKSIAEGKTASLYLVTGGSGELGTELQKILKSVCPSHTELDIRNPKGIESAVDKYKPSAIIHLAAKSDQRWCEKNRLESYAVNVIGTRNVAQVAARHGLKISYMSTDYVFPGSTGNYDETMTPQPPNWYGYTKYAGELEVQLALRDQTRYCCIIRGSFRPSNWGFPTAFTNVFTSADYTDIIAQEIATAISLDIQGIIHIGTPTKSFFELAKRRNPAVLPEVCTDDAFPKKRDLNINNWLKQKTETKAL